MRLLVFLLFLLMALQNLGIDLLPLIAGLGIAGEEGVVDVISLFSTTLQHADLSRVVVPNRKIAGEILHNYGEIRQLNLGVRVAYGSDLDAAIAAIGAVLAANPRVLRDPAPVVQAAVLGEFSINIAIKPWVAIADFIAAPGEINPAVVHTLRERDVLIAVPAWREIG